MKTLDLDSIEEQARATIRAAFDPTTVFLHDADRGFVQGAIAEGIGAPERLALVGVIRDLQRALAAVLPYAEDRVADLSQEADEADSRVRHVEKHVGHHPSLTRTALDEAVRDAQEARGLMDQAIAAMEDAKAELDSLVQKTRPPAKLEVWKTPNGTWTVRHEMRDEQGRRCVNFLGEWVLEGTAREARRAALRGLPVPPNSIKATGGPPTPGAERGQ